MITDSLGNPVTLREAGGLGAVNDFVEGFIACEARVVNILQVAETDAARLSGGLASGASAADMKARIAALAPPTAAASPAPAPAPAPAPGLPSWAPQTLPLPLWAVGGGGVGGGGSVGGSKGFFTEG